MILYSQMIQKRVLSGGYSSGSFSRHHLKNARVMKSSGGCPATAFTATQTRTAWALTAALHFVMTINDCYASAERLTREPYPAPTASGFARRCSRSHDYQLVVPTLVERFIGLDKAVKSALVRKTISAASARRGDISKIVPAKKIVEGFSEHINPLCTCTS